MLIAAVWIPAPLWAQDAATSDANPLAALYEEARQALLAAGVPFSAEQRRAIVLMMEDRRKASEELFGDLMDFRGGPTQGEQEDRLRSANEWMRGEFLRNVAAVLAPEQTAAWGTFLAAQAKPASPEGPPSAADDQTQHVRIHNNAFTAEDGGFGGGGFTEVIRRGGRGAWHGNAQLLLKDDTAYVRLGEERFVERVQSYLDIAGVLREQIPDIDYVDLRFDERVYVRPQGIDRGGPLQPAAAVRGGRLKPAQGVRN